jgi:hypothetical protein
VTGLTPEQILAARVIDVALSVTPARVRRAQAGNPDSSSVGIPWRRFLELLEALEAAYPGALERTRERQ